MTAMSFKLPIKTPHWNWKMQMRGFVTISEIVALSKKTKLLKLPATTITNLKELRERIKGKQHNSVRNKKRLNPNLNNKDLEPNRKLRSPNRHNLPPHLKSLAPRLKPCKLRSKRKLLCMSRFKTKHRKPPTLRSKNSWEDEPTLTKLACSTCCSQVNRCPSF
jgi:hypothetical protein